MLACKLTDTVSCCNCNLNTCIQVVIPFSLVLYGGDYIYHRSASGKWKPTDLLVSKWKTIKQPFLLYVSIGSSYIPAMCLFCIIRYNHPYHSKTLSFFCTVLAALAVSHSTSRNKVFQLEYNSSHVKKPRVARKF
jgi:hypothetical protein